MSDRTRTITLALQGGGSHGAFTWGALDRLLHEVAAGRLRIAAISGTSAGSLNAALTVSGLVQGGAELAREKLAAFWRELSVRGFWGGNGLFFHEPNIFGGYNLDYSPVSIAIEMVSTVVSPYTNVRYSDALQPLIEQAFPATELEALNASKDGPRLFVTTTNVATNERTIFSQPDISTTALRASCCLPTEFRTVFIDGAPYWDGGYLGNPSLAPLVQPLGDPVHGETVDDLLLVLVNAFRRDNMPPLTAPGIADRLNEITFNASVVLEVNAIEAVNSLLRDIAAQNLPYRGKYRPIRLHAVRDDEWLQTLGFVSKQSTSWALLSDLHDHGFQAADKWLHDHWNDVGRQPSLDVKAELTHRVL
jgi:NTE family protein